MPVVMSSFIVPASAALPYLIEDKYVKGGLRYVDTEAARDAIHAFARKEGMLVYVKATKSYYQLADDMTTWTLAKFSADAPSIEVNSPLTMNKVDGTVFLGLKSNQIIPKASGAGYVLASGANDSLMWLDIFGQQSRGTRSVAMFEPEEYIPVGGYVDFAMEMAKSVMLLEVKLNAYDIELTGWSDHTRSDLNPYTFISAQGMLSDEGITLDDGKQVKHRRYALLSSDTNWQYFRFTNIGTQPSKPRLDVSYLILE